jgi:hypothetical protein
MAAPHAIAKMLIHHSTRCPLELGWGSSTEAVNADTIESAKGMMKAAAETTKPVRERASHRWLRCSSRFSDTERKSKKGLFRFRVVGRKLIYAWEIIV